jgi:hypothetical protein
MRLALTILATFVLALLPAAAQESDKTIADSTASSLVRALASDDLSDLYDRVAGPSMKIQLSRELFQQQFGMWRIQSGGPAATRTLVGSMPFGQIPNTLQTGTFYYVRYKAAYPNGQVFEDVYLENDKALGRCWVCTSPLLRHNRNDKTSFDILGVPYRCWAHISPPSSHPTAGGPLKSVAVGT